MVAIIPVIVSHSPTNPYTPPDIHHPAIIAVIVLAGITVVVFLGSILISCCRACSKHCCRQRNTRQTARNPTEAQNRWYDRMKRRSGSNFSNNQSPEVVDDTPIGRLRRGSESSAAPSTTPTSGQPPAYVEPIQPQRVFLNTDHNSSRATVNSLQTTSNLPLYHRRHHDELCQGELQEPGRGAAHTSNVDPSPAPYTRYWNPWSTDFR